METCGDFFLLSCKPGPVFDYGSYSLFVKRIELILIANFFDKLGIFHYGFVVFFCYRVEFRFDFEDFFKIGVKKIQKVVYMGISDQNNFDIYVDRLRFQSACGDQIHRSKILYFKGLILQRAFEGLPYAKFHQRIQRVHNQVSTVSLEKGSCFDLCEICLPYSRSAHCGLYGSKNVKVIWIGFHNHRCSLDIRIVDQKIYTVF